MYLITSSSIHPIVEKTLPTKLYLLSNNVYLFHYDKSIPYSILT